MALAACGDDGSHPPDETPYPGCPTPPEGPAIGSLTGSENPLGSGPAEARAGRVHATDLPPVASGLITWADGDFVLANDKVALVIEDVGDSDLYDPWGGRPVGLARIQGGKMIEPADFGEFFLLTGRSSVVTTSVTVIADGSGGGPAVIRASGKLAPLPFFDNVVSFLFQDDYDDITAAIDYSLAPGAETVDITYHYYSPRDFDDHFNLVMHGFMFTQRMRGYLPGLGFSAEVGQNAYYALIDDDATSWAYAAADGLLGPGVSASGFVSGFTDKGFDIKGCAITDRPHARITIGGPGLDGLLQTLARADKQTLRVVSGTVRRGGVGVAGAMVHATTDANVYVTRAITDASGHYELHTPAGTALRLTVTERGLTEATATVAAAATSSDVELAALGSIHVVATADGKPLPVRVQVLPAGAQRLAPVPGNFGDPSPTGGRLHVEYPMNGDITLPVPAGSWDVVVSRGYEYEIEKSNVPVEAGKTALVEASPIHVVDSRDVQCADFHIHTTRSNDADDDGLRKVASAVADGLEMPVRSDHEFVGDFRKEITALGVGAWAAGFGSIELTSMEVWGHMGVFPLVPDLDKPNGGAPLWQSFPTAERPGVKLETLSPHKVFDDVRARPEKPIVIINHPRGGFNYFTYVGYNPATGGVDKLPDWDTTFTAVEVFNDSAWKANRERAVKDWLSFLKAGRHVFAVGSSDSHGITTSPVGYPRTCLRLGTDDPTKLTANQVRDAVATGHGAVSGGIFVEAKIGDAGPGDTVAGGGPSAQLAIKVQAPSWIDVDTIEVIVDSETVATIPVTVTKGGVRYEDTETIMVGPHSYVVVVAYGDRPMDEVHPGRIPFGVTNPIFIGP